MAIHCPNCKGTDVSQDGNKLTCGTCDAVYKLTGDGARVVKKGVLDDHENRLQFLEQQLPAQEIPSTPGEQITEPELAPDGDTDEAPTNGPAPNSNDDSDDDDSDEVFPR